MSHWLIPAVIFSLHLAADDWPQWRGPNRDNVWRETNVLSEFPRAGLKVCWRAPIGPGFSSPIVAGGRVYVTESQIVRPTARERVVCFDALSGRVEWSHAYDVDYPDWAFDPNSPLAPRATPIAHQGRIFALGARGRLLSLEAKNGQVLWEIQLDNKSKDSAFTPSPLIEGNLVILALDGLPEGQSTVCAINQQTGARVWSALKEIPTFASPLVMSAGGRRQLIVWTKQAVRSLDPATGQEYWREPYAGGVSYPVPSPAADAKNLLLFVNGVMFRFDSDHPSPAVIWPKGKSPSRQTMNETTTPLFLGDHLFTCNMSGELVCLEPLTGQILWSTNRATVPESGASLHMVQNGSSVLIFNDQGELLRCQLSSTGYVELARSPILSPTSQYGPRKMAWVPPAYSNGRIYARSDTELVCVSLMP